MLPVLLAAISPVQADIDFARWVMQNSVAKNAKQEFAAELTLWVDPSGRVKACEVTHSVGSTDAADRLCRSARGRKLQPARIDKNTSAYGIYSATVVASSGADPAKRKSLVSSLERESDNDAVALPVEFPDPQLHYFSVVVDQTGHISECKPFRGLEGKAVKACTSLIGQAMQVRVDKRDEPVAYITKLRVRYVEKGS